MASREYYRQYHQKHKKERNKYSKEWCQTHREKMNEYQRNLRRRLKVKTLTYYSIVDYPICARCGIIDIDILCLDHIEGGGRKDIRERNVVGGYKLYYQLKREGYPKGYQVLCANCNLKKQIVEGK